MAVKNEKKINKGIYLDKDNVVPLHIGLPPIYGIFFDGTNNNKFNAIKSAVDDDSPTNVAKLFELYNLSKEKDIDKLYIIGVGTTTDEENDEFDGGFAFSFGKHLQQAIDATQTFFKFHPNAKKGIIDVFGFSRGAAAARAFVNEVHRTTQIDPMFWGGLVPEFRFVGLYDTVGSIGVPGDNDNDNPFLHIDTMLTGPVILDIHEKAVKKIVHITAGNELREYFPLSSLRAKDGELPDHFVEEQWPGAHSDVGGGYGPGSHVIYFPHVLSYKYTHQDLSDKERAILIADVIRETESKFPDFGNTRGREIEVTLKFSSRQIGPVGKGKKQNYYRGLPVWNRKIEPQLPHVTLKRMHELALESRVPLEALELLSSIDGEAGNSGIDYIIPDDLKAWIIPAKQSTRSNEYDKLYKKYIHHSHQYEIVPGEFMLKAQKEQNPLVSSKNGEREMFYNNPKAAIDPNKFEDDKAWEIDNTESM